MQGKMDRQVWQQVSAGQPEVLIPIGGSIVHVTHLRADGTPVVIQQPPSARGSGPGMGTPQLVAPQHPAGRPSSASRPPLPRAVPVGPAGDHRGSWLTVPRRASRSPPHRPRSPRRHSRTPPRRRSRSPAGRRSRSPRPHQRIRRSSPDKRPRASPPQRPLPIRIRPAAQRSEGGPPDVRGHVAPGQEPAVAWGHGTSVPEGRQDR